jgi:hypothetical protein
VARKEDANEARPCTVILRALCMSEPALTQHVAELVRKLFWRPKPMEAALVEGKASSSAPLQEDAPSGQSPVSGQPIAASKVQLIGLGKVREVLGERWPKLAERVRSVAQVIIDRHLLPGDICEPHSEEDFIVLFPLLSFEDAKFKSDAICREIERRLIGENMADIAECRAETSLIGPAEAFLAPEPVSPEAEPVTEHSPSGDAPQNAGTEDAEALDLLRRKNDRDTRPLPSIDAAFPEGETAAPSDAPSPSQEEPAFKEVYNRRHTDIEWSYRPVWDFNNATLIMFALYPHDPSVSEAAHLPNDMAAGEYLLDSDTAAISKCVNDLSALSASGRRLPLLSQIHYGTVDNARRRAFIQGTVRDIAPEFRKLMSVEIVGCPINGLNFGLSSFIASLRSYGVRVALRVDARWPDFLVAERAGVQIVTMDTFDNEAPESERMIGFEIFAARAANAKLEAAMWGLASRSLVVAAASAGIRYLAGGAVAPEITSLSHAVRFSPVDLYPHTQRA